MDTILSLGATYIAGIANIVPRRFWPEKPVGAGPRIKNSIYPYSYAVGKKKNSSITTGFFNELQMNFGIFGIPVGAFFFGLLFSLLIKIFAYINTPASKALILSTTLTICTQFYYAEFLGLYTRYVFAIAPLILMHILNRLINRNNKLLATYNA